MSDIKLTVGKQAFVISKQDVVSFQNELIDLEDFKGASTSTRMTALVSLIAKTSFKFSNVKTLIDAILNDKESLSSLSVTSQKILSTLSEIQVAINAVLVAQTDVGFVSRAATFKKGQGLTHSKTAPTLLSDPDRPPLAPLPSNTHR